MNRLNRCSSCHGQLEFVGIPNRAVRSRTGYWFRIDQCQSCGLYESHDENGHLLQVMQRGWEPDKGLFKN